MFISDYIYICSRIELEKIFQSKNQGKKSLNDLPISLNDKKCLCDFTFSLLVGPMIKQA